VPGAQVILGFIAVLAGAFPVRLDLQHLVVDLDGFRIATTVEQLLRFFHLLFGIRIMLPLNWAAGRRCCPGRICSIFIAYCTGRLLVFGLLLLAHKGAQFLVGVLQARALVGAQVRKVIRVNRIVNFDHEATHVGQGGIILFEQCLSTG
jgi:hypothetical protein